MEEVNEPEPSLRVTFPELESTFPSGEGITIGQVDGQWTFRHEASQVLMGLEFLVPGPSELRLLSPCCKAFSHHKGAEARCSECNTPMPNPHAKQDGDYVGQWCNAVVEWLDPFINPLEAVAEAAAIEIFVEEFEQAMDQLLGILAASPGYELIETSGDEVISHDSLARQSVAEGLGQASSPKYHLRRKG